MPVISEERIAEVLAAIPATPPPAAEETPESPEAEAASPVEAAVIAAEEAPKEAAPAQVAETPKDDQRAKLLAERIAAESKQRAVEIELRKREEEASKGIRLAKLAEEDAISFLQEIGQDVDTLARKALEKGKPDASRKVMTELEAIKVKLAEREALDAAREQERLNMEAVNYIKDYAAKSGDKFELTRLYNAENMVFARIQQHFNETGEVLSEETACGDVERYLEGLAETALKSTKIKAKLTPKPSTTTKDTKPKTLTNNLASQVPVRESSSEEDDYDWKDIDSRINHVLKKHK